MSIRNSIAENIVETLTDTNDPKPIYVTRESIDLENLSRAQFPSIVVRTSDEVRSELTMLGNSGSRFSTMNVVCECYVTGTNIDHQRNEVAERVEEALVADLTRGGVAKNTKLVELTVDQDIDKRFGLISLTFDIEYIYTRGAA
jgi:hypothetical protein